MWRIWILLVFFYPLLSAAQNKTRPSIGVTLSGGGAKGLAHIGILKAIDAAGIKVDYLTGTSMGGIIGALYAAGYSAAQIERLARQVDWDELLTNQSSLRGIVMQEKKEYSKYAIELPWVNNGFRLPSGVLEGEELWLKFSELFFPVYNIKDFKKLSIPFTCVSADIATGEAVVLDKGEIIPAIRASMAIPSLFTAVEINGQRLIDGGVVRNFPVKNVKEMGADYVIGSRVAMGLQPKEKVANALQILLQIVFFKEAITSREEIKLCDLYIPMPLENYTAASFGKAKELIDFGVKQGEELLPSLKRLADSLNAIYGKQYIDPNRLPKTDSIYIASIEINGLDKTTSGFFQHTMGFSTGKYYTPFKLAQMVRKVFGTRYYNRIVYSLQPLPNGAVQIKFDVGENPQTFAKLGIHYNKFTGISLIGNLTSRNFLLQNSRSLVSVNLGENFRIRAEHLQYLGRGKNIALILSTQFDNMAMTTYNNFIKDGLYGTRLFKTDAKMEYSANRKFTLGAGTRFEWIQYKPSIQSIFEVRGKNDFFTTYGFFAVNTLNKSIYPVKGLKIEGEFGEVFNQHPEVMYYSEGIPVFNPDSTGISYNDYQRVVISAEGYTPITHKLTLSGNFQSGVNFNYKQSILNDFMIGGMSEIIRNQVLFAGLEENTITTSSVAAVQLGIRYELYNNVFISGKTNALVHNFVSENNLLQKPNYLTGYAVSFAYNFALGPLEISAMYCDQAKRVRPYINLGISF